MKKSKFLMMLLAALCTFGIVVDVNALQTTDTTLPETVNRVTGATFQHDQSYPNGDSTSRIIRSVGKVGEEEKYILYCSDFTNHNISNETLTKDTKMDYGIAYILMNSYPTKTLISGATATESAPQKGANCANANEMANIWITQSAIWGYQGVLSSDLLISNSLKYYPTDPVNGSCDTWSYNNSTLTGSTLWNGYVSGLISSAKAVKDPADSTLSVTGGDGWTKTDDGYKSSLISVAPSSSEASYSAYSLTLEGAPDGVKVYTEAGEDITSKLDNITAGTKVYVFVPSEQAKKGPKFTLKASTTITYNAAYKYVDKTTNYQPSVLVGPETKNIEGAISLNVIPDTASSISNSIYFVGVLILLCGAGIIYANVKPKKQTNE